MPAGGTARSRNGAKLRGSDRKATARTKPSKDFDTELFLTTVGAGKPERIARRRIRSQIDAARDAKLGEILALDQRA